jgi:hypothetical protein
MGLANTLWTLDGQGYTPFLLVTELLDIYLPVTICALAHFLSSFLFHSSGQNLRAAHDVALSPTFPLIHDSHIYCA